MFPAKPRSKKHIWIGSCFGGTFRGRGYVSGVRFGVCFRVCFGVCFQACFGVCIGVSRSVSTFESRYALGHVSQGAGVKHAPVHEFLTPQFMERPIWFLGAQVAL